eukprot:SAG31_NODE_5626_length_2416_cov_1.366422_2_plen_253_part_00
MAKPREEYCASQNNWAHEDKFHHGGSLRQQFLCRKFFISTRLNNTLAKCMHRGYTIGCKSVIINCKANRHNPGSVGYNSFDSKYACRSTEQKDFTNLTPTDHSCAHWRRWVDTVHRSPTAHSLGLSQHILHARIRCIFSSRSQDNRICHVTRMHAWPGCSVVTDSCGVEAATLSVRDESSTLSIESLSSSLSIPRAAVAPPSTSIFSFTHVISSRSEVLDENEKICASLRLLSWLWTNMDASYLSCGSNPIH